MFFHYLKKDRKSYKLNQRLKILIEKKKLELNFKSIISQTFKTILNNLNQEHNNFCNQIEKINNFRKNLLFFTTKTIFIPNNYNEKNKILMKEENIKLEIEIEQLKINISKLYIKNSEIISIIKKQN